MEKKNNITYEAPRLKLFEVRRRGQIMALSNVSGGSGIDDWYDGGEDEGEE